MPKEPLFPHRPKIREPLFPHVPKGQRVERLPQAEIRPEKTTAAFMEIAEWFVKYRRPITVKEMQPVVTKYFPTEGSFIEFLKYLKSPKGMNEFRRELRDAMRRHGISMPPEEEWLPQTREEIKHFWVEENRPYGTWAVVEAFPGGTVRSPFDTKEEAIKREREVGVDYEWNLKQVPSPQEKFPKQHEALNRLSPYIIAEYHDDGDLTVRELIPIKGRPGFNLGRLYVVTTDGEVFEETQLAMILPATRGGPLSKYCCRFSDACAPPELLEEGKFLERISWLRQHYKEKHPGMWGKK